MAKAAKAAEATIAGEAKLDARKLHPDFPIFQQRFHGNPLAYLDSAVTAQKPRQVLDAQREFYETTYTNVHRSFYLLAEQATERFEGSREKIGSRADHGPQREADGGTPLQTACLGGLRPFEGGRTGGAMTPDRPPLFAPLVAT